MILKNLQIVTDNEIIDNGYLVIEKGLIQKVGKGDIEGGVDCHHLIAMSGFIDIHIHGSAGIDFMDAEEDDYKIIADSLYKEGVTTFLATTLTSDKESLARVCKTVANVKDRIPSLGGIHFEGPYINEKHKGAQNEEFIRDPNIEEFDELQELSNNNIRYISLAPERNGALEFIKHIHDNGVVVSAGHTDATFEQVKEAIKVGLSNTTHTHNAMSGHHHRNPGVVTAAFYFDELFTECICDKIHVCPDTLKTFYKIVGPDRFVVITDALKIKNSDIQEFKLFGLDCIRKNGAAYLTSGPLAGSLLTMEQALKNMRDITGANLVNLAKICSKNAAKSMNFKDRGILKEGLLADIVLLDNDLNVKEVYKLGEKVA